ncbi:TonB-dependent hemoglobin/transferrin/lactoferrin family receptor [Halomonas sp. ML-15]|uniref:TonB-dependent receptor n=1 Tax=Halomonas sp. ML-15 TaxID=2773305 RepID=UPI001745C639|nr:TonB-dependent receptor [Halomonas sp. ML-15]MBD3896439.1 TonB-dependent hemoglobin/transferrin/lactoferrin family receptor [Halomonas sp. ML-15]
MQHGQRRRLPGAGKSHYRKIAEVVGIVAMLAIFVALVGLREAHGQSGESREVSELGDNQPLAQQRYRFDLPEQSLLYSLGEFTAITNISVLRPDARAIDATAPAISGEMTADEALRSLLSGTGLEIEYRNHRTAEIVEPQPATMTSVDDQIEFSTLTVEADRLGDDWVYHEARSVNVITREQIDRHPPRHIAEILQETPGVNASMNYQTPGLALNIRGMQDFGRVNMMVDGARQNYAISGHQQRNGEAFIDPEFISDVIIEKGPSASLGSGGTLAGSANFRTVGVDDIIAEGEERGVRLRGSTGIGKYSQGNDYDGSVVAGFRAGNDVELLAGYSQMRKGEFRAGSRGQYGRVNYSYSNPTNKGYENEGDLVAITRQERRSGLLKGGFRLTDTQRLSLSALRSEFEFDTASSSLGYSHPDADIFPTSNKVETSTFSIGHEWRPDSDWLALDTRLYYVDTRNDQEYPDRFEDLPDFAKPLMPGGFNSRTRTETYGITAENNARFTIPGFDVTWNYGFDISKDETSPRASGSRETNTDYASGLERMNPEGERWLSNVFNSLSLEHNEWLTLQAGLRYDHYELTGEAEYENPLLPAGQREQSAEAESSQGAFSPNLGIAIKPFEPWQLYANWGKSWRPPTITQALAGGDHLYVNDRTRVFPSPDLGPERSETWEVGSNLMFDDLFLDGDRLRAKVSYFTTRTEDFMGMAGICPPRTNQLCRTSLQLVGFVNVESPVDSEGFEVELSYDTGRVYGRASYTDTEMSSNLVYDANTLGGNSCSPSNNPRYDTTCNRVGLFYYPLPPRQVYTLQLGTRAFNQRLDVGLRHRYSSGHKQLRSDVGVYNSTRDGTIQPYNVTDFYAVYTPTENLRLNLTVDNLRDEAYGIPMGDVQVLSPSPGRTVIAGAEYRF